MHASRLLWFARRAASKTRPSPANQYAAHAHLEKRVHGSRGLRARCWGFRVSEYLGWRLPVLLWGHGARGNDSPAATTPGEGRRLAPAGGAGGPGLRLAVSCRCARGVCTLPTATYSPHQGVAAGAKAEALLAAQFEHSSAISTAQRDALCFTRVSRRGAGAKRDGENGLRSARSSDPRARSAESAPAAESRRGAVGEWPDFWMNWRNSSDHKQTAMLTFCILGTLAAGDLSGQRSSALPL